MHGKHIRSQILKHAYAILKPNPLPEENLQLQILGGTFEIVSNSLTFDLIILLSMLSLIPGRSAK